MKERELAIREIKQNIRNELSALEQKREQVEKDRKGELEKLDEQMAEVSIRLEGMEKVKP